jgi:hypothetical protein
MEDWTHRAASKAQSKYRVNTNPASSATPKDEYAGPDSPLPGKSSTMGSVAQRISWRTPAGVGYSAQSRSSTLFDEPTSTSQVPREG